jgi:hypothetical protein
VTLFASGYIATSGKAATPTTTEPGLSCESTAAPAASCAPRNAVARAGETAPRAKGREAVRSTFLSISRSQRSLTVHPAPRRSSAPTPKRARRWAVEASSGEEMRRSPAAAAASETEEEEELEIELEEGELARRIDQAQGHASSQVPAGLSSLASSA